MSAPGGKWGGRGAAGWLWIFCLVSAGWGAPSVAVGAEPEPKEVLVSMSTQRWLYNDAGTDLGSTWHATVFPAETQWRSGLGLFGVESSFPYPYPLPLATPLVLNAGRTTYYFRTRFHFSGDTTNLLLRATSYIDDGAVFYLNGNEVDRVRLPQGAITFSTKADLAFPEGGAVLTQIPVNRLLQGDNVLAVEVHQNSDTSSDVVFGLKLETFSLVVPVILNPAEPSDRTVPEGESTTLTVSATGFPEPSYQWYRNGVRIAGATAPSLTLPQVRLPETGTYFVEVSNSAGAVVSRTAAVGFLADTNPPFVLYALAQPDPHDVLIVFSEPVDESIAADYFNWTMEERVSGAPLNLVAGRLDNGTNLLLTTLESRDPTLGYTATVMLDIPDLFGNVLAAQTVVPIAAFELVLAPNDATQAWKVNDSGIDLGTEWRSPGYADVGWRDGQSPFHAYIPFSGVPSCRDKFPVNEEPIRTCLSLSNASNSAQISAAYFRTRFEFEGNPAHAVLRFDGIFNEGVVLYLNGVELSRLGLPNGTIRYQTLATRSPVAGTHEFFDTAAPSLVSGENLLAVEVHRQDTSTAELTFACKLSGVFPQQPLLRPRLNQRVVNGQLELTWSAGALQSAESLAGPWIGVAPSNPPYQHLLPPGGTAMFFRVIVTP